MYESEDDLDFSSSEVFSKNQETFGEDESDNEYEMMTNKRKVFKKKVKKKRDNFNELFQSSSENMLTLEQRQIRESADRFHQNLKELMEKEEEEKRAKRKEREQPTLQNTENHSYTKIQSQTPSCQNNEKNELNNSEELIQQESYERDLAKNTVKEQESLGASGYSIPVNNKSPFWNTHYQNETRKRERESAERFDRYLREFMEKEEEETRLRREKSIQRTLEIDESHSFRELEGTGNKVRINWKRRLLEKLALIEEESDEEDLAINTEVEPENLGASGYSILEYNQVKTCRKPTSSKIKQYLSPESCLTEQLIEPEYCQPTAQDMVLMDAKKFSEQLNLGIKELLAEEEKTRERRYLEAQKQKNENFPFKKYNKQEFESSFLYMSARDETRRKERLNAESFGQSLREFMDKEDEENRLNEGKREQQSLEIDDSYIYEKIENQTSSQSNEKREPINSGERELEISALIEEECYEIDLAKNVEKEEDNTKPMDAKEFSEQLDLGVRELMAEEEKIRERRNIRAQKKMKELLASAKYNKKEFESSFLYMSARDEKRRKERISADSFDRSLREFMYKEEENRLNEGKREEQSLKTDDSQSYEKLENQTSSCQGEGQREPINSKERELEILDLIEQECNERDLAKNTKQEQEYLKASGYSITENTQIDEIKDEKIISED